MPLETVKYGLGCKKPDYNRLKLLKLVWKHMPHVIFNLMHKFSETRTCTLHSTTQIQFFFLTAALFENCVEI